MLRLELYVSLYLLIGCGYYLYHKAILKETLEDYSAFPQMFTIGFVIVFWPFVWILDAAGWLYYNIREVKRAVSERRKQ